MEPFKYILILFLTAASIGTVQSSSHHHSSLPKKLFVFGDSYADTGNLAKPSASSWHVPYGTTFPQRPSGRFSDGRVLTDFIARFMRIRSPIPYRWMDLAGEKIRSGMNFAYGGSGVFQIMNNNRLFPNMSTQIDYFQNLINKSVYTVNDLQSSVVYVSSVGNDYAYYLANNGTTEGLQIFIPRVVNQIATNLERISQMGATKIVLTGLQPLGCFPQRTIFSSYTQCVPEVNLLVNFHNQLLNQVVATFNNQTKTSTIVTLDLYNAFTIVFNRTSDYQEVRFKTPLKPCCMGTSGEFSCGSLDVNGTRQYTVCSDPTAAFFWDGNHPTQAGWGAVFPIIESNIQQLF